VGMDGVEHVDAHREQQGRAQTVARLAEHVDEHRQ
jgi:hypothetical protein